MSPSAEAQSLGQDPSQDTSCIFKRWPRLATWSQVWGVDRGWGRRGLMSWISRFQKRKGMVPTRSMTPVKVCRWEGFIITKWP